MEIQIHRYTDTVVKQSQNKSFVSTSRYLVSYYSYISKNRNPQKANEQNVSVPLDLLLRDVIEFTFPPKQDYEKWSSAARAFENVGDPEFLGVVKEFTSVLEQIKTHEFILNQYVN